MQKFADRERGPVSRTLATELHICNLNIIAVAMVGRGVEGNKGAFTSRNKIKVFFFNTGHLDKLENIFVTLSMSLATDGIAQW